VDAAPDLSPYERLVELARTESDLVSQNDYEALGPIATERAFIVEALPGVVPVEAGPLLAEALAVVGETQRVMTTDLHSTERALAAIDSGRRVATGYGGAGGGGFLDARG
jgi:hypothetical protein